MNIDPESFKGKVYLLFVDKVIVGAIVALAIFLYDDYRVQRDHAFDAKILEIQRSFERARLTRELLPAIADSDLDPLARGYMLRSALEAKSISPEAAVGMGNALIGSGLSEGDFIAVMHPAIEDGLSAVARVGVGLYSQSFAGVESMESPRKIWRAALMSSLRELERSGRKLSEDPEFIAQNLPGIFHILQTPKQEDVLFLMRSRSSFLRVVGSLISILRGGEEVSFGAGLPQAGEVLTKEVVGRLESTAELDAVDAVLGVLLNYGATTAKALSDTAEPEIVDRLQSSPVRLVLRPGAVDDELSVFLASLVVHDAYDTKLRGRVSAEIYVDGGTQEELSLAHYEQEREHARELLLSMPFQVQPASKILIAAFNRRCDELAKATDGKRVSQIVRDRWRTILTVGTLLKYIEGPEAERALERFRAIRRRGIEDPNLAVI